MLRRRTLNAAVTLVALAIAVTAQEKPEGNLARSARASVSSSSDRTKAENLNDGDISHTQWTAKDGTNPADTWAELNWPTAVQFQEIVIRQEGDRKLFHLNIEVREATGAWRLVQSVGDSQHLLPRIILVQFAAISTTGLRLSAFTGSVSMNEIEVYN